MPEFRRHEVHIIVACADARDFSPLQQQVFDEMIAEYAQNDVQVDLHTLRVAGSFMTPDVIRDIKRTIEGEQRRWSGHFTKQDYFVHIYTHGCLKHDHGQTPNYNSHLYDVRIEEGSPLNCGMLEATYVGLEIEQLAIEQQLEVKSPSGTFRVHNELDLSRMLREVYAYEGYLAGDWLKGIDKLRSHPRLQRRLLEDAIRFDPDLRNLGIRITAGINDYSIHSAIRLDGGHPEVEFWDKAMLIIRDRAADHRDELLAQSERQQPTAGLFSMSNLGRNSRIKAAEHYLTLKSLPMERASLPNAFFHLAGTGYDLPETPFGPYAIGGFYYAVKYLNLRDWLVLGGTPEQTQRMMSKLDFSPLLGMVRRHFQVNMIPVSQTDLIKEGELLASS